MHLRHESLLFVLRASIKLITGSGELTCLSVKLSPSGHFLITNTHYKLFMNVHIMASGHGIAVILCLYVEPTILQAVFKPLHEVWRERLLSQIAVIR